MQADLHLAHLEYRSADGFRTIKPSGKAGGKPTAVRIRRERDDAWDAEVGCDVEQPTDPARCLALHRATQCRGDAGFRKRRALASAEPPQRHGVALHEFEQPMQ